MINIESSSQLLCKECGLCCDGTLFDCADIKPGEDIVELKKIGITTIYEDQMKFTQPCAVFDNTCTIYHARPKVCQKYMCKLLIQHQNGDICYNDALAIIQKIKTHREKIENQFVTAHRIQGSSFMSRYRRLSKLQAESGSREQAETMVNAVAFKLQLERYFNKHQKSSR